jgi:hypothetical protein
VRDRSFHAHFELALSHEVNELARVALFKQPNAFDMRNWEQILAKDLKFAPRDRCKFGNRLQKSKFFVKCFLFLCFENSIVICFQDLEVVAFCKTNSVIKFIFAFLGRTP